MMDPMEEWTAVANAAALAAAHPARISPEAKAAGNVDDADYAALVRRVQERFEHRLQDGHALFTTDADVWKVYLAAFPPELRQHHDCRACRRFLESYGGLAIMDERGNLTSAMWDPRDEDREYLGVFAAMADAVRHARVTGVHLSSEPVWGTPTTKQWIHLALRQEPHRMYRGKVLTAAQAMAEKKQDHDNVMRALADFSPEVIEQALVLLKSDALYRAEKVIGPAQFLADLHAAAKVGNRTNVVWRAVASAPAGFCHPRSSMIGTLLEDLASGMSFQDVSRRFAAKMHPLAYQRPQAAPSEGQVKAAEELVAKLGIAASLRRRFARLEECETLWRPSAAPAKEREDGDVLGDVFGYLLPSRKPPALDVPAQRITWLKFVTTVLPAAVGLDVHLGHRMNFGALVTAVDPAAPPILQWDREGMRNPVSWYLYNGGSTPTQWCVSPGWAHVDAVVPNPVGWYRSAIDQKLEHQGNRAFLIVRGARDSRYEGAGAGLFPEILKSELHAARSVIETHSRKSKIEGYDQSTACGVVVAEKDEVRVRITHRSGNRFEYIIDRWD